MLAMLLMSIMGSMAFVGSSDDDETASYDPHPDGLLDPPEDADGMVIQTGPKSTYTAGGDLSDWIAAGRSCDTVDGGAGNDTLFGERGRDMLDGGDGDDMLYGGAWHDALAGGAGDDALFGEGGKDTLAGGEGDDRLDGGAWDDLLVGGAGADVLDGGDGDDILMGHILDMGDRSGTDLSARAYHEALEHGYHERDIYFSLDAEAQQDFVAEAFSQMQALYPGAPAGEADGDTMHGGKGNDTIGLGHDRDIAYGGSGADRFIVADWADHVATGGDAAPVIADFGTGDDVLVVEYLATEGSPEPVISVETLENGDQLVRADGAALVRLVTPVTALTAGDISLVGIQSA